MRSSSRSIYLFAFLRRHLCLPPLQQNKMPSLLTKGTLGIFWSFLPFFYIRKNWLRSSELRARVATGLTKMPINNLRPSNRPPTSPSMSRMLYVERLITICSYERFKFSAFKMYACVYTLSILGHSRLFRSWWLPTFMPMNSSDQIYPNYR